MKILDKKKDEKDKNDVLQNVVNSIYYWSFRPKDLTWAIVLIQKKQIVTCTHVV